MSRLETPSLRKPGLDTRRSGRRRDRRDPPTRCRPPSPRQTPPCRPDRKPHTHSGRGGCSLLLTLELLYAVSEEGVRRAVARQSSVASVTPALAALRNAGSGDGSTSVRVARSTLVPRNRRPRRGPTATAPRGRAAKCDPLPPARRSIR